MIACRVASDGDRDEWFRPSSRRRGVPPLGVAGRLSDGTRSSMSLPVRCERGAIAHLAAGRGSSWMFEGLAVAYELRRRSGLPVRSAGELLNPGGTLRPRGLVCAAPPPEGSFPIRRRARTRTMLLSSTQKR